MIDKTHLIKEVCVETYGEAIKAKKLGADRIELCKRLDLGGLTPQRELIEKTLSLSIPIKVMIRPRAGNFIYNENELTIMEDEIETCKSIGVQEIVLGLLDTEKNVNVKSTARLALQAYPMDITFHKAIDSTNNLLVELERLSSIQYISSILTSGGEKTAEEGSELISEIIKGYGSRFRIIAAGSITDKNFDNIHLKINSNEYHGRKILGEPE